MLLFTLTIKEAMNMYNSRHLTSYRQLFQNLYRPFTGIEYFFEAFFYIMVLMAVSATISGAASLSMPKPASTTTPHRCRRIVWTMRELRGELFEQCFLIHTARPP